MILKQLSVAALCALSVSFSYGFQSEAGFFAMNSASDGNSTTGLGVSAIYSLEEINNYNGPLGLAYFMSKASTVTLNHSEYNSDFDYTSSSISGDFVIDDKISIGVEYNKSKSDFSDSKSWRLSAGYFLSELEHISIDYESDEGSDLYAFSLFSIYEVPNDKYIGLSLSLNVDNSDDYTNYRSYAGVSYYLQRNLSHTLSHQYYHYDNNFADVPNSHQMSYGVQYFYTSSVKLGGTVGYSISEGASNSERTFMSVSAAKRF